MDSSTGGSGAVAVVEWSLEHASIRTQHVPNAIQAAPAQRRPSDIGELLLCPVGTPGPDCGRCGKCASARRRFQARDVRGYRSGLTSTYGGATPVSSFAPLDGGPAGGTACPEITSCSARRSSPCSP